MNRPQLKNSYILLLIVIISVYGCNTNQDNTRNQATVCLETLQGWYNEDTGYWKTTSWWNAANALTAIIDYTELTGSDEFRRVIDHTFETCKEFEVEMPDPADNWICRNFINDYYDDEGWWILAWIAAYDLTAESKYLDMAKITFADMCLGWDSVCQGGIYWKKPNIGKSAIQNELFLLCAARLHQRSPDEALGISYYDWAQRTWQWFDQSGMINDQYLVDNGLNKDCEVNRGRNYTYNQGVILSALAEWGDITQNPELLALATRIADAAIQNLVDLNGILQEPGEPDLNGDGTQFKGIFMRHLGYLYTLTEKPEYKDFILKNTTSLWQHARNEEDAFGAIWSGPFDQADASRQSSALDAFNAALRVAQ